MRYNKLLYDNDRSAAGQHCGLFRVPHGAKGVLVDSRGPLQPSSLKKERENLETEATKHSATRATLVQPLLFDRGCTFPRAVLPPSLAPLRQEQPRLSEGVCKMGLLTIIRKNRRKGHEMRILMLQVVSSLRLLSTGLTCDGRWQGLGQRWQDDGGQEAQG